MKGNNIDTKIEKLFENYAEEPSPNCWDVVSQKLNTVMPAGSSASSGASSGTSAFTKFMTTVVGKSIAIISAVSIVGVSLYVISNRSETTSAPSSQPTSASEKQINNNKITQKQTANSFYPKNKQATTTQSVPDKATAVNSTDNSQIIAEEPDNIVSNNNTTPISATAPKISYSNPITNSDKTIHSEEPLVREDSTENNTESIQSNNALTEKAATVTNQNTIQNNLVFPNVFTPNGDGVNDYFVIKNIESLTQQKFVVVNAAGQKVFEANNYQNNWDASNVPDGAYFYVLETKIDGKVQTFYGTVQVIR